jgi:UDP-N-acetylglucosamine 2-epimerase (non-hydrolysing)
VRVICVAGARTQLHEVKPVMDVLEERRAQVILVHTGQYYERAMSDVFFADLGIRRPDTSSARVRVPMPCRHAG